MRKLIIILISIISIYSVSAQKRTDIYINDANKVGLIWLNDVNHNQYENAYGLLAKEGKAKYPKEIWIAQITELMLEFGNLESRRVAQRNFQSQIEGIEDGFYVFIEYISQYENKKYITENLILKQNDKAKWEIFDYNYEFKSEKEE
jgi:hypothetical protein